MPLHSTSGGHRWLPDRTLTRRIRPPAMSVPVAVRCGERLARPRRKPGCAALRAAPDRDESMNMKGHWCSTHGAGTRGQGRPAHVPATKDSAREKTRWMAAAAR